MVVPKNSGLAPKNSSLLKLSNHVWHYGSKTDRSYLKKYFLPKTTLKMWFLFDTFPPYLTLSKYCWHLAFDNTTFGTFYCFLMLLSFKMSHHEAYWGWKCRSYEHFCKKFPWTTKNWKNSFLSYKCNFHILCISDFLKFFYHKKVETLRFSNMYDTYRCPSFMWMLSFGEGMEKSENGQC